MTKKLLFCVLYVNKESFLLRTVHLLKAVKLMDETVITVCQALTCVTNLILTTSLQIRYH